MFGPDARANHGPGVWDVGAPARGQSTRRPISSSVDGAAGHPTPEVLFALRLAADHGVRVVEGIVGLDDPDFGGQRRSWLDR